MTDTVNETQAATVALDEVWRLLAPIVDEAKKYQSEVKRDPSLFGNPWVEAHLRWLTVFEPELAAVQKVHEASGNGAKLSADDVRAAHEAATKLLQLINEARARVRVPQPA